MNAWTVTLLFEITGRYIKTQADKQAHLIEAHSASDAYAKAMLLGAAEEASTLGDQVKWNFKGILNLNQVSLTELLSEKLIKFPTEKRATQLSEFHSEYTLLNKAS